MPLFFRCLSSATRQAFTPGKMFPVKTLFLEDALDWYFWKCFRVLWKTFGHLPQCCYYYEVDYDLFRLYIKNYLYILDYQYSYMIMICHMFFMGEGEVWEVGILSLEKSCLIGCFFSETRCHLDDVLLTRSVGGPGESIGIPVRVLGFEDGSFNCPAVILIFCWWFINATFATSAW